MIAGGLENGTLELWDAESLLNGNASSFETHTKHSGAIKTLKFNHIQPNVIATGGVNGEIYIWDLKNLDKAIAPGRTPSRQEDVEAIAWNNGVTHILASGSSSGTSVWDLKNRKEVIHLSYTTPEFNGHSPVSSIAWHPDNSTTLITASSNESSPVILLWDLRNANAPQKVIKGHDKGILSLDWCKQDSTFLLSSGKDNKTFLWDTNDGSKIGEYPVTSNWNFQTSFSTHYPDIFASASYDGKISIQTLQDTNTTTKKESNVQGDDFWSSNNYVDAQHPVVSLKNAPKWLKRPCSAAFGFGGKVVSVRSASGQSTISITNFTEDESLTTDTAKFASALKENKIPEIISENISLSEGTEKHDWELLQLITEQPDKTKLKSYILGDEKKDDADIVDSKPDESADIFSSAGGDDFLSNLSISSPYVPSGPFEIFPSTISSTEKNITKAVLAGDFEKAVDIALKEENYSDAFALSSNASDAVKTKVRNAYLSKNAETKPFLRILAAASSGSFSDIVSNSNVSEWKDVLGAIFTYSKDESTFKTLLSELGDRLLAARSSASSSESADLRNNALFCYVSAANLAGASSIWVGEINDQESEILKSSDNQTPYSAHVKALHKFIEKVTIFKNNAKSSSKEEKGLDQVYSAYREYANIVATQGQLDLAEVFLNFLPSQYAGEKERVRTANKKVAAAAAPKKPSTGFPYSAPKPAASAPSYYNNNTAPTGYAPAATTNPYGAPAQNSSSSPYAPAQTSAYAPPQPSNLAPPTGKQIPHAQTLSPSFSKGHGRKPSGIYPPSNPIINSYAPAGNGYGQPAASASPVAPPPKRDSAGGWNDLPTSGLPQTSRRSTPAATSAAAIPNPFAPNSQPLAASNSFGRHTPAPLGPPPSGPPPISRSGSVSSSTAELPTPSSTGPSAPINPYAPKPGSPTTSRQTPYGQQAGNEQSYFGSPAAPPTNHYAAVSPPPNPYAAAAAAAPPTNPYAAPPTNPYAAAATATPATNPYASAPAQGSNQYGLNQSSANAYGPPPTNSYAPSGGSGAYAPPQGNGFGQPSSNYPPQNNGYSQPPQGFNGSQHYEPPTQQAPPPEPEPPVEEAPKYPPGDRSHISEEALPIYELLESQLNAVKPKIPATYQRQLNDIEKRLGILFDHLNNDDLLSSETVTDMVALSQALAEGKYDTASEIRMAILTTRTEECGQWMAGVKRLIDMARVIAHN